MNLRAIFASVFWVFLVVNLANGEHDEHGDLGLAGDHAETGCDVEHHGVDSVYNPGAVAFHHISDQNIFTIGPWWFNLPCILYAPGSETPWSFFSSAKFHVHSHHGDGDYAYNRYVLHAGVVMRVVDESFPLGEVKVNGYGHRTEMVDGEEVSIYEVCYNDHMYLLDQESAVDGGLFNRGITSFYDFSITKNVLTMILVAIFLGWMFIFIARTYEKRDGTAPSGLQSFMEPIYIFIREDVAKAMIGPKYEKFMPFIMSLFMFILVLNLVGQVPFFGNPNVTGSLAFTMVLAIFAFVVTNIHGNGHYWQHVLWMPGIPVPVKVIMTPVEILGLFLKPITLMVRLFANITAGHIVLLSFMGLVFIFGQMGQSVVGSVGGGIVAVLLGIFMSSIELLVAFLQAFIFAILTASYIGAAVAEDHH